MRRTCLVTLLLGASACHQASFEPVLPRDMSTLEREVVQLIESKASVVRAAPSDGRAHATLGLVYEANEQWDEAARCFANAIAIDDAQPLWLYHRALVLGEAGQTVASIAALREAARKLETSAAVQQRLGQQLLSQGEFADARAAFGRALVVAPESPECLAGMAGVEIAGEHWNEALVLARRALAADPSYTPAAYFAGLALQGLGRDEEARDFLALGTDSRVRWLNDPLTQELNGYRLTTGGLMEAAGAAVGSGNYARGAALYEKVLARKPKDPEVLNNLSGCLIELGQFDRAEQLLELTLRCAPASFAAHLNFATLALKRQDLQRARYHADLAVELGGSVGRTHFMRSCVMVFQDDWTGAEKELRAAVELDARNPQFFLALAEILAKREDIQEARMWCGKAVAIDPNLAPARESQCSLALKAGDLAEAREALAALEKLAPTDPGTIALRKQVQKHKP